MQTIEPGDEIIVLAEDNDSYKPAPPRENVDVGHLPPLKETKKEKEKVLFCGWRRDLRDMLIFIDSIVEPGSEVHIMTHFIPITKRTAQLMEEGLDVNSLKNIKLVHHQGNTSVRKKLEALPFESFASCMIFADQEYEADTMHADSHSLATLLLCRDLQVLDTVNSKENLELQRQCSETDSETDDPLYVEEMKTALTIRKAQCLPITCEILDPRTQKTIAGNKHVALSSEFCQTNLLIAQIVAMIAEERSVKALIDELLGPDGASVEVTSSTRYCNVYEELSFFGVSKRALQFEEIVIGYQLRNSIEKTVLNPPDKEKPMTWGRYDFAIMKADRSTRTKAKAAHDLSNVQTHLDAAEQRRNIRQSLQDEEGPLITERSGSGEEVCDTIAEETVAAAGRGAAPAANYTPRVEEVKSLSSVDLGRRLEIANTVIPLRELQCQMSAAEWKRIGTALGALQQILAGSCMALQRDVGLASVHV